MATAPQETTTGISLESLDITKPSEIGFEFEYISEANNKPTGVFFTVLGSNSNKVQEWTRKELNRRRQREAMNAKRGKDNVVLIEDDEEFGVQSAVIRVVSWRGITEECTPANVRRLCELNPEILGQIIKNSNELSNFIKSK
jgi:hypothetical protein